MSSKPFAFDVDKLNKFISGDIGIADAIYKLQITPILNSITDSQSKNQFIKLSAPNKKSGLWATEKTIVSTMLETHKPVIELIKICLELFGSLEYTIAILLGGSNPLNDTNSFSGAFAANKAKMSTFKTGMEPSAIPPGPEPVPPPTIFLGQWQRDLPTGNVYSLNGQPQHNEFTTGHYWPQYQSYNEFYNEEQTKLQTSIKDVPLDMQPDIINGRNDSIGSEWSDMQSKNQTSKNYDSMLGIINISKYYKPQEVQYLNKTVEIDIEENYDVVINRTVPSTTQESFYIYAKLKPELTATGSNTKAQPELFPGGQTLKAIKTFLKKVLPIIIKKLIPVIVAFEKLMSKPAEFIGNILMTKLKEHFEMFDPSIKGTPAGDKFWSGDKFVMDGIAAIDVGILKMTLGLKNGLPTFKTGTAPSNTKEQPILKMVANLAALPINFLKGILDAFKELLKKIFKVLTLPQTYADFITFKWIKDLLALPKLLEFVGASGSLSDGTFKIPLFEIPKAGNLSLVPDMFKAFMKMIVMIFNGFITIPNTILNMELVPKIPTPN